MDSTGKHGTVHRNVPCFTLTTSASTVALSGLGAVGSSVGSSSVSGKMFNIQNSNY